MKGIIRHIVGYCLGMSIFILLIPFALFEISKTDRILLNFNLIDNLFLRVAVSLPFFLTAVFFMLSSNIFLLKIGKGGPAEGFNIAISPRTKKLVSNGPYSYTRNPMVFGALSLYFSIAIFLNSLLCLISVFILLIIVYCYLIFSEEKRLLKDFGKDYQDYKKKVPMLFPFKKNKKIL
ncbi:MAG: isoprenylcysteine carboxylmethyltransferase family protein [Bacteroidota bacterium]